MSDATLRHRTRPMLGRDPHEEGRTATTLELLFDLTFVVAFGLMIASAFSPLWSWPVMLAVWGGAAVIVPLVTFRFSRGLWMALVHLTGGVY